MKDGGDQCDPCEQDEFAHEGSLSGSGESMNGDNDTPRQTDAGGSESRSTGSSPVEALPLFSCCICKQKFRRDETGVFPFCSKRCQQIDLGRWYNEQYTLPMDGQEESEFTDESESLE